MTRPRLLFLSHILPFPPDSGVKIRTHYMLRILASRFDICLLAFHRRKGSAGHQSVGEIVDELGEHAEELHVFDIPQERSRLRFIGDHLGSLITQTVYTRWIYCNRSYRRMISAKVGSGEFAIAHVDSLDLSAYIPALAPVPTIVGHHNIESQLLARRATQETSSLKAAYIKLQGTLMEEEEKKWAGRVSLNVCVSGQDAITLQRIVPGAKVHIAPNGVDIARFRPSQRAPDGSIVFVGGTSWFPNRDALQYFATEILPCIRRTCPEVVVRWVGRATPTEIDFYGKRHGIEMTGYVESIEDLVHSATCYVVPLRVGGGTRLKILDAWAMGKAVVSTPEGCEGLAVEDGVNILIRSDAAGFAQAVVTVLQNAALSRRLGVSARQTAEEVYDWDKVGRDMLIQYESIMT